MADPSDIAQAVTHLGTLAAGGTGLTWAGKKLFGPVLDEVGKGWAESYSDYRKQNVERMLHAASLKGANALQAGDEVSPRVVHRIIEDGSWADDRLMADYFGGIWAASLSQDGSDDRGVVWADLVSTLAADDVYLHYLIYEAFRRLFLGRDLNAGLGHDLEKCGLYLPMVPELEVPVTSRGKTVTVRVSASGGEIIGARRMVDLQPSLLSLSRHGLISDQWALGDEEHLAESLRIDAPSEGCVVWPSHSGIELFLWAHGCRAGLHRVLDSELDLALVEDVRRVENARELREMQAERQQHLRGPT